MHLEILTYKEMEKTEIKKKNIIQSLLEFKRDMRECIKNGADPKEMKRIADDHGFQFAKPI